MPMTTEQQLHEQILAATATRQLQAITRAATLAEVKQMLELAVSQRIGAPTEPGLLRAVGLVEAMQATPDAAVPTHPRACPKRPGYHHPFGKGTFCGYCDADLGR